MTVKHTHPIVGSRVKPGSRAVGPAQKNPLFVCYLSVRSGQMQRNQIRALERTEFSVLQTAAQVPRPKGRGSVKADLAWLRQTHHPALTRLMPANIGITKDLVQMIRIVC